MAPRLGRLATFGVAVVALLAAAPAVSADGEASGIVVSPPIAKAGDEIVVQGFALWTELPVTVQLVGRNGASRAIGEGLTGPDGTLNMEVRLPDDVPAGQYTVLVLNIHGEQAGAPVVVQPELPVLPLVALGGATIVVAITALAAWRRRTPAAPVPLGDD